MSRLVDYFVIVGFDHEKERGGLSNGIILQRFPETNWEDTPFHEGIEWFCQPQGWSLSTQRSEPQFYVSVLTDVDANRHYCACLCFNETVAITPSKPADEVEESPECPRGVGVANITHHSVMYAPKCLVIVSRQDYIDTFRNCLGIIYTVWVENLGVPLETLVGNLVGCVLVPPPGGPQVRFSLGAGDRQTLTPGAAPALPSTGAAAHLLLRLLGVHNAVTLWSALMAEHKVLLVSLAAARLGAACRALAALMFPFRYAHVFIPLLPAGLAEVLATPTPFLIGVHSNLKEELTELLDVIVADLDVGSVHVPAGVRVPRPDGGDGGDGGLCAALSLVLQPELRTADAAFPPPPAPLSPPHLLDKEIRAVFMRTLARLLQGYRHCLTIIRIHPSPVLTFHKAGFLGARGLADCEFATRLLDSMFFNGLVSERGPPWRPTDIFDDLVLNLPEQLRLEALNPDLELKHIRDLAMQIHLNENPNPQPYQQRIPRPPEGASSRVHQPPFPRLDSARVAAVLHEVAARNAANTKAATPPPPQPRIVPPAAPPGGASELGPLMLTNSARRLEVLRACIAAIFECRYADARKSFPAVVRALRSAGARAALVRDLAARLPSNKHLLQHQQFDLLTRLMNCALQSATAIDEHSLAAAMLPLATAYCRKLCTGVIQYAYMCIQEHPVWTSQQFWEAAFYQDVQRDIKALYMPSPAHHQRVPSPRDDEDYTSLLKSQEPSALEIAAEQMRLWPSFTPEDQKRLITNEESTLYSQAIHYANRMVYLLLPLEGAGRRSDTRHDDDRASNSITNSVAESDSADAESGFEEADPGEAGTNVIKMVSRFVDKVCTEGGVSAEHVRCLHQMIPGVVHMHLETLDAVAREARRLPPVHKPRIVPPALVSGEALAAAALRAVLVPDGRPAPLLPAEGALFLTNYRVVFRGTPTDPYACEQTIVRSFPLSALTREKAARTHYLPLDQPPSDGLQLRSATFQLIKVALDEEVSCEQTEAWRRALARLRHPEHPLMSFALAPRGPPPQPEPAPKAGTLRGFAKKTLLKTARRAGLKPKPSKRQKYVLPSSDARALTSPPLMASLSADTLSLDELELGGSEVVSPPAPAPRTLERVRERVYARDWARLGLAAAPFRLTHANAVYTLCRSYPAVMAVPEAVGDESLRRTARSYRQGRLPVLTYRHPRTHALLARSAAPHHKGVMGMLKSSHSHPTAAAAQGAEATSSVEQERYLSALVACTPLWRAGAGAGVTGAVGARSALEDSSLSLDSLLLCCDDAAPSHTPLLAKANVTLSGVGRNSGGKGGVRPFGRWGSLKGRQPESQAELPPQPHTLAPRQRLSGTANEHDSVCGSGAATGGRRAALYVLTDKGSSGGAGGGGGGGPPGVEPVPVEYPDARHTKHAFKKLMRAAVPSAPEAPTEPGFLRLVEESGWLWQLRQVFQLSGAVVDLLDLQGSSVLLALEDGWDGTAQISSLAQICLDPYYRTLEGFRIIIEKEWLALGHKFQQRSNIGAAPQQGFTPTFLMFLDAVHQVQKQFPLAFEFNEYYLRFLAYHLVSCRFRTFLLDCEAARAELGITAADDRRADPNRLGVETGMGSEEEVNVGYGGSNPRTPYVGQSIFDYIDKHHQKSPIFYNFFYTPDLDNPVLRPVSAVPALEVWEYYLTEELAHGTPYDLEAVPEPDQRPARRTVSAGYDSISQCMPDAFSGLLERLRSLELELGHLPQKWRVRWDLLELPNTVELQRVSSLCMGAVLGATRLQHKRGTLEVLVRGRQARAGPPHSLPHPQPHRWAAAGGAAPVRCDHCQDLLWGPLKTGVRCVECGAACHERCADSVAVPCGKLRAPPPADRDRDRLSVTTSVATLQSSCQQYYEQFSSNVAENRTHEGHLYKRGALLKGWKQRWFVLDSIKHQLRYYDAMEDSHCKGFIDLAEVVAVAPTVAAPPTPKKCDDRAFFDLRTSRRTYNFCASDANAAQEWIEKLQACLQ